MADERDWERLARYVVARRVELGYQRQIDLVNDSALSLRTLSSIESGERSRQYNRTTIAAVEQALRWPPGSIEDVLNGAESMPTEERERGETEESLVDLAHRVEGLVGELVTRVEQQGEQRDGRRRRRA